ncbi:hypothetical protein BV898_16822 [Hypsibius exemplaris]|uniref:Uncharacterized protein n=1 Tax=Hypsibius exemplaris TaxID=2072580 RepID=A0A9X6NE85_HYPEX|nr:hypothetical protein BV898_16822 [Hypsibius exemplaris]
MIAVPFRRSVGRVAQRLFLSATRGAGRQPDCVNGKNLKPAKKWHIPRGCHREGSGVAVPDTGFRAKFTSLENQIRTAIESPGIDLRCSSIGCNNDPYVADGGGVSGINTPARHFIKDRTALAWLLQGANGPGVLARPMMDRSLEMHNSSNTA